MGILTKLGERYDNFYRRYFSLTQDNWKQYVKIYPVSEIALRNLGHPIFGKLIRMMFKYEGEDRFTQSYIVPIDKDLNFAGKEGRNNMVMPVEKLRGAIEDSSYRVILHRCICRDGFKCETYPRDFACIMVGEACRNMVQRGIARYVTVEEALEHLDKATELGLVAIAAWAEFETIVKGIPHEDHFKYFEICFCCPCCCVGMRNFKKWYENDDLRSRVRSMGWRAQGTEDCVGCGICAEACPMDVIEVAENSISVGDKCIGCGICSARCPKDAIVMEETMPMKDKMLDYFRGFKPQIFGG